jgi:hypothetical protein
MDTWGKPGYQLGYTDSYSDIPTHTVMYNVYTSISRYIKVYCSIWNKRVVHALIPAPHNRELPSCTVNSHDRP